MTVVILVIIHVVGILVAYGRFLASGYELNKEFPMLKPTWPLHMPFILFGWIAFVISLFMEYYANREEYLFKWNYNDLWEKYYEYHPEDRRAG